MRRGALGLVLALGGLAGAGCSCHDPRGRDRADRDGSLGSGDTGTASRSTGDTALPAPPVWVAAHAGGAESCGLLDDNRLLCWGDPELVELTPAVQVVQLSVGNGGGCGLEPDGSITCWCSPNSGYDRLCDRVPSGEGFVEVRNGTWWGCAEDASHVLTCWGTPEYVNEAPTEPVLDWSIEEDFGCAVFLDGSVSCWGSLEVLTLADPDPATEPPPELKYTQVAVGRDHACALDADGEAHCWGSTHLDNAFPTSPPEPGPWASITAWNFLACALRADGTALCWWDPELFPYWTMPDEKWSMLGLGEFVSCGVTLDGRALCFPAMNDRAGETVVPDIADL